MAKRFVVLEFEMEEANPDLAGLASARCWSIPGVRTCEAHDVSPDTTISFHPADTERIFIPNVPVNIDELRTNEG